MNARDDYRFAYQNRHRGGALAAQDIDAAMDEINRLRQWKSEAILVLANLDDAFDRVSIDGGLGRSKPDLMASEIDRLRSAATKSRATA